VLSPTSTWQPTHTPTNTLTPTHPFTPESPTAAPPTPTTAPTSATLTPPPLDPRKTLPPGVYIIYWRKNTWYIRALDGSPGIRLLPVESPNSSISFSPDKTRAALIDADNQVAVYDMETGALTTYPSPSGVLTITGVTWSGDGKMLMYTGYNSYYIYSDAPNSVHVILLEKNETRCIIGGCIPGDRDKYPYSIAL
jgi:WD40 repeat protein